LQLRTLSPAVFTFLAQQLLQPDTVLLAISCFRKWLDHRAFLDEGLPADAIQALTEKAFGLLKGKRTVAPL
jgi:hypothetical protein